MSVQQCGGSGGTCPCRRTRRELDDAKDKRVKEAMRSNDNDAVPRGGGGGPGIVAPSELPKLFPKDEDFHIVHKSDDEKWVCSHCDHFIALHPDGSSPEGLLERIVREIGVHPDAARHSVEDRVVAPSGSPRHMSRGDRAREIEDGIMSVPSFTGSVVVPKLEPSTKSEGELQKLYTNLVARDGGETTVQTTPDKVVMTWNGEDYKPDITIYNKELRNWDTGVAAVIELKRPVGDGGKSVTIAPGRGSTEVGQVTGYLHAMMMLQKNRRSAFGVLTNHHYMQVFEVQRQAPSRDGKNSNKLKYFLRYTGDFKEEWIQFLCCATLAELGCNPPTVTLGETAVTLRNYLGSGQYSHGYEVTDNDTVFVIKQFNKEEIANQEREVCRALVDVSGAAQLHTAQPQERLFVAITPKGLPFNNDDRKLTRNHVLHLKATIRRMHETGYVHGDIASCNIYFINKKEALLNDWSHSEKSVDEKKRAKDFLDLSRAIQDCGGDEMLRLLALHEETHVATMSDAVVTAGDSVPKKAKKVEERPGSDD